MAGEYKSTPSPDGSEEGNKKQELRGSLIKHQKELSSASIESALTELMINQHLVNRDSGTEYTITRIDIDNDRMTLIGLTGNNTITLSLSRVRQIVSKPGGPWRRKTDG